MKQGFPGSKVRYSCNDVTFLVISRGLSKQHGHEIRRIQCLSQAGRPRDT